MDQQGRAEGVAVVTGAAGSMGRATASALSEAGWNELLVSDLNQEALDRVTEPLRAKGAKVAVYAGDVAAADYPSRLIAALRGRRVKLQNGIPEIGAAFVIPKAGMKNADGSSV